MSIVLDNSTAAAQQTGSMIGTPYPALANAAGCVDGNASPHTTRTMMLSELRALLATCPPASERAEYRKAVVEDNALLKATASNRRKTFLVLKQLYGLDPSILLFRVLRELWDADVDAQPLLAMLCALARDPTLRATVATLLGSREGDTVSPSQLAASIVSSFPERFSAHSLRSMGQNVASSWQQSGHLRGKLNKVRLRANSCPVAVAYALLLGHLCGERGQGLFETMWSRVLDTPPGQLRAQAATASQQGWLEYRHSGDVTDVSFRHLLRDWQPGEAA